MSERLIHHICSWLPGMYLRWDTTVAITKTMFVTLGTGSAFRKGSAAPQTLMAPSAHLVESRQRSHEQAAFCGSTLNTHHDNTGLSGWAALCAQLASVLILGDPHERRWDGGGWSWRAHWRQGEASRGWASRDKEPGPKRPTWEHVRGDRPTGHACSLTPHCWSWGPRDRESQREISTTKDSFRPWRVNVQ